LANFFKNCSKCGLEEAAEGSELKSFSSYVQAVSNFVSKNIIANSDNLVSNFPNKV